MKILIAIFLVSCSSWAKDPGQAMTEYLVCAGYTQDNISCVSKASIERDQLEIELLNLKIEAFKEAQAKKKKGK